MMKEKLHIKTTFSMISYHAPPHYLQCGILNIFFTINKIIKFYYILQGKYFGHDHDLHEATSQKPRSFS